MIKRYIDKVAAEIDVELSTVTVVNAQFLGCLDVFIVRLSVKDTHANVLVHQFELDAIRHDSSCHSLDMRVRAALTRLQMYAPSSPPSLSSPDQ